MKARLVFLTLFVTGFVALGQAGDIEELIFLDGFDNHAPVIVSTPLLTGQVGVPYAYDVDATDLDGDPLLYLLTVSPTGMSIDPASGLLGWNPNNSGAFDVMVDVSDGQGGSAQQSWTISVAAGVDSDEDGLSDLEEETLGTDPEDPDSDDDGLLDGAEVNLHHTDPLDDDSDNDRLTDGAEVNTHGTLPLTLDTDGDHFGDGFELTWGTDPLNPASFPEGTPDPEALAPDNDATVTTSLFTSVEFLFNGSPPIQTGVDPDAIDPLRIAVVRGKVMTREGSPLPGVTISIHGHPELGMTATRVDGGFDMAVNGGGLVAVDYTADGFLPGQRMFHVQRQDWTQAPDVALIPADAQVTAVDLTAPGMKMAQGTQVTDADGPRQAAVLFPEGVTATLKLPGGGEQPLGALDVRATEYTVGPMGPQAMPGILPQASGYTYAVELSVDEALASGGQVEFSMPLPFYVENFLDFPVGTAVPAGYYDRDKMTWIAAPNGRVIEIVAINAGLAEIDSDGDTIADDPGVLAALGITEAERQNLAATYAPGTSLWRVPVEHFTPWDYNWPYSPPADAVSPNPSSSTDYGNLSCEEDFAGSIVTCQTQVLGERVPVTGTPFTLNYRSNRTPGRSAARQVVIRASGDSVPASLERIDVSYSIAGTAQTVSLAAAPNQELAIVWNGLDAYGREIQGSGLLTGQVEFVYQGVYRTPAEFNTSFAGFGDAVLVGKNTRQEIAFVAPFRSSPVGSWDARAQGLGAWTLDVHHAYDVNGRKLYLGDGRSRNANRIGTVLDRVIPLDNDKEYEKVGAAFIVAPNADIFFLNGPQKIAYRRDAEGNISRFLGCDPFQHSPCTTVADGAVATQAAFETPDFTPLHLFDMADGPDGSVYVAGLCFVARVDAGGIVRLVGGSFTPNCPSDSGDGGPATAAEFLGIRAIDVGPEGNVYIVQDNHIVRRIGPDGIVTRFAGNGVYGYGGDGGPATSAMFRNPRRVAVGPSGAVYISDSWNFRIRAVGSDGIIRTVVGNGSPGYSGDGGPATSAQISDVGAMAISPDGDIFFHEWGGNSPNDGPQSCRIRKVDPAGIITLVGGDGDCFGEPDWPYGAATGGFARDANWGLIYKLDFGPDGELYFLPDIEVWKFTESLPDFDINSFAVASEDGAELYIFDAYGRHLQTINTLTAAVIYEFGYDGNGWLSTITDGDGKVTTVERGGMGKPTAIVGPFGQQTDLATDPRGFLSSITNPAGEQFTIQSSLGGLIKRTSDPRGRVSNYAYDSAGRLISQSDNGGYSQQLDRIGTTDEFSVTRTSGMGRTVSFDVDLPAGNDENQVVTAPDGSVLTIQNDVESGMTASMSPYGVSTVQKLSADSRFGLQSPRLDTANVTVPGGLMLLASTSQEALLDEPSNLLSLVSLTGTWVIDGRTASNVFTAANRTLLSTSPAGRMSTTVIDALGRAVSSQFGDLASLSASYNALGQLESLTRGSGDATRITLFTYGGDGYRSSVTDALGRTASFVRDEQGRVISKSLAGNVEVELGYDQSGDLTSITPPGRPPYSFTYDLYGQLSGVVPPDVPGTGPTTFAHNADRQLTSITRAGGEEIVYAYDTEGRTQGIQFKENGLTVSSYAIGYVTANQVDSIVGPGAQSIAYEYQGDLLSAILWSGPVEGSVSWEYDNAFRKTGMSLDGGNTIGYAFDDDDFLVAAGDFTLTRSAVNGLVESATLGLVEDAWTYNGFGEVESRTVTSNAVPVYAVAYTRDDLGRITQKAETLGGVTDTYDYAYDPRGQLMEVQKNSVVVESYVYDDNGNRSSTTLSGNSVDASYDDQDRLLTWGDSSYAYTPAGRLLSRTQPGDMVTSYDYDVVGSLRSVTLPDLTEVGYALDGQNRRIQRSVNGAVTHRWLYEGLMPIAELDELGNVVSQFIYATGGVPAYMIKGGVDYRFVTDQVGSVRLVVDSATGAVAQRIDYDSFGNVLNDTNPGFQPFGFAGGLYDPDTQLLRFGARDYDPQTGRWTAKDPQGFSAGDTNLYRYVLNRPIGLFDRTGSNLNDWFDELTEITPAVNPETLQPMEDTNAFNARKAEIEGSWSKFKRFIRSKFREPGNWKPIPAKEALDDAYECSRGKGKFWKPGGGGGNVGGVMGAFGAILSNLGLIKLTIETLSTGEAPTLLDLCNALNPLPTCGLWHQETELANLPPSA